MRFGSRYVWCDERLAEYDRQRSSCATALSIMASPGLRNLLALASALILHAAGCAPADDRAFSYYDSRIDPILAGGCQRQTTGCHVDDGDGFALGNLDLTSYASLTHRSDVLTAYGPYPVSLLLLKAGDPIDISVETIDPPDPEQPDVRSVRVTTDVKHGGGEGAIAQGSRDYAALKQWLDRGYAADGVARNFPGGNRGECTNGVSEIPGVDYGSAPSDAASYERFVERVHPVLIDRCAGSSCHGAKTAELKLSCGDTDDELRSNYESVLRYLNEVAVSSELLRRPLAASLGGVFHEGGDIFTSTDDVDYRVLRGFAEDVVERRPELLAFTTDDEGLRFFANRVQPVLVKKGCMFLGCHSPAMFHDLRLRGGAGGDFSEFATRRNHKMSKLLLALESENPNASRLIAKNVCPPESGGYGIKHRGGALLEDFGGCGEADSNAALARCDGIDAEGGDLNEVPAYCVLARWQAIERELAIERGELTAEPAPQGVVFVARPLDVGGATSFDELRPGADLIWSDATVAAVGEANAGAISLGALRSLLAGCGFGSDVDVRGPAVSWDATRIAFAARTSQSEPLRIYEVRPDGSQCEPRAGIALTETAQNGILIHDFDPAYAPDGRMVFASTRGYVGGGLAGTGPTRTPARLEPNANLFVQDASGSVRQLTFLLDQELTPSFMADGRVIMTTEKRAEDFHQLAGRRINLDGGDYHPLFAQRPSIGFASATEIVELANRNLAFVASTLDARDGGGSIAIVNRSIGPDQSDRARGDRAYIHALTTPISGALSGETGIFRSPSPLPDGSLIASCDLDATDLSAGDPHYALCQLDSAGQSSPTMLFRDDTRSVIEAVAVYARGNHGVFASRLDEANGSTSIDGGETDGVIHYLDVPMLGSLLFSNTREGRPIDPRVGGVALYQPMPPPTSLQDLDSASDDVMEDDFGRFYQSLMPLGSARSAEDGSLRARVPAGVPLTLALTNADGDVLSFGDNAPFSGAMRQREAFQVYPGERTRQSMPRGFFNGLCAGCHGSVSGDELDIGVRVDVLTSASRTLAEGTEDLR